MEIGKKHLIIIGVLVILIGIIFFINLKVNGSPGERKSFNKEVEFYIKTKYPDIVINKQKISYSFKEMKYRSLLTTDSDVNFNVWLDYDNHLVDNYYVSMWEQKAGKLIFETLQESVKLDATITLKIDLSNEEMLPFKEFNSFAKFKDRIHDKVRLIINYGEKSINDDLLKECFEVLEWMSSRDYRMKLVFLFKGEELIQVEEEDFNKIRTWEDLKKYKL